MPFGPLDLFYGCVVPVIASTVAMYVAMVLRDHTWRRGAPSWSMMLGFLCGYFALSLGPASPEAHWHWLPYVCLFAAVVGPAGNASELPLGEQFVLYLVGAAVVGWFLIPDWNDLDPAKETFLLYFSIYVSMLATAIEVIARNTQGSNLPVLLGMSLLAAAVLLALSGNLRFSQIALCGAASMGGVLLFSLWSSQPYRLSGLGFLFACCSAGSLLVGYVNSFSDIPGYAYGMIPLAPLAYAASVFGPLVKGTGFWGAFQRLVLPIGVMIAACVIAFISEQGAYDGY